MSATRRLMQSAVRAAQTATAPHVLRLYRSIMRYAKGWPNQTDGEFIRMEARELFKRNMTLSDPAAIERKIIEADTRVALALHYKNPHPRPFYGPPGHSPERIRAQATAVRRASFASLIVRADSAVLHGQSRL